MKQPDVKIEFKSISYAYSSTIEDALVINNMDNIDIYVEYINAHNIEKLWLGNITSIDFLYRCPNVKYLVIRVDCDYEPLYQLEEIKLLSISNDIPNSKEARNMNMNDKYVLHEIDICRIRGLVDFGTQYNYNIKNLSKAYGLKSVFLSRYKTPSKDLTELSDLTEIDQLRLILGNTKTLKGIEKMKKLQCVYLDYQREMDSIDHLHCAKDSLKMLRIDGARKIKDFDVLGTLENLELLQLDNCGDLPNLNFIKKMKKLNTFTFNTNVLDGDLSPCMNLQYVYSEKNRKHFNIKDKDLPRGKYVHGNEDIEEWRRYE